MSSTLEALFAAIGVWFAIALGVAGAWIVAVELVHRHRLGWWHPDPPEAPGELELEEWACGVLAAIGAPETLENIEQVKAWARSENPPTWLAELELPGVEWPPPSAP